LWELASRRFAYLDPGGQSSHDNWRWLPTEAGVRVIDSPDFEPQDPGGYLEKLAREVPDLDEFVVAYLGESLRAFDSECYLASAVMLGVASERAFLLVATALADWLPDDQGKQLAGLLASPRSNFIAKFNEFRKRLEPRRNELPPELSESLAVELDAVADLLRTSRNEAGHPTGKGPDRGAAFVHLQLFGVYVQRLWALRRFFLERGANAPGLVRR
jgi:hypothetical protein